MVKLSSLVPNATDLLELEVEELGGILLIHLHSCKQGDCTAVQNGQISQDNFFRDDRRGKPPEYGAQQEQVDLALLEAWAWLQSEGLLVKKGITDHWLVFSRRGKQITSRDDVASYLKAHLLPKRQIHPMIANKVYPAFLRGEYDTAVFQSFREVEVSVRQSGGFPATAIGVPLMRDAFRATNAGQTGGPLADRQLPVAEQEAMASLFAGVIALFKNRQSHRHVPTHPEDASEVIMFASQLLRMIDRVKP
jgi:uncharacterized protein (TIGR02391 family)